jgi:hypothetical protein
MVKPMGQDERFAVDTGAFLQPPPVPFPEVHQDAAFFNDG